MLLYEYYLQFERIERISFQYDPFSEYLKYEVFEGQQMTIVY